MGLTFFSDRFFAQHEMSDALYHCALPLTDISLISDRMVSNAFASISKMYYGGDDPEDVLMGEFLYVLIFCYFNHSFRNCILTNRSISWLA